MNIQERIFRISSDEEFNNLALELFHYQLEFNPVYSEYVKLTGRENPRNYREIPFLPIEFFKSKKVLTENDDFEVLFKSSGTTGQIRSLHYVKEKGLYIESFTRSFKHFFGAPKECVILALLPNYIEQGNSSLVFMVDHLIRETENSTSKFILDEPDSIVELYLQGLSDHKKVIIFGVSYSLLDLAEKQIDLSKAFIIETGGMKGRRSEVTKEELHQVLKIGLGVSQVYSEYGMTELLSQGYSMKDQIFETPPWMRILCRDINDPFEILEDDRTGGINVIDLANIYSCPFISTQDLGKTCGNQFKIMGRFDQADIRGCNLMVE